MKELYIRNYLLEGDSENNRIHFRSIYFMTVGDFHHRKLADREVATAYAKKVIHLQRKY